MRSLRVRNLMATVDVKEIHNIASLDPITLIKTTEEVRPVVKVEHHEDVPLKTDENRIEHAVRRNVRQEDGKKGNKYLLQWYGYSPSGK